MATEEYMTVVNKKTGIPEVVPVHVYDPVPRRVRPPAPTVSAVRLTALERHLLHRLLFAIEPELS
jgi:hypothetical protein